jgi:hypothetical protein
MTRKEPDSDSDSEVDVDVDVDMDVDAEAEAEAARAEGEAPMPGEVPAVLLAAPARSAYVKRGTLYRRTTEQQTKDAPGSAGENEAESEAEAPSPTAVVSEGKEILVSQPEP